MFGDRKKPAAMTIDTLIGAGTVVEGSIRFRGGLRIDGTVIGSVRAEEGARGMLVVSETARIEGDVRAAQLVINGTLLGPVHADELIELQPQARVVGDVAYRALEMHHGAVLDGRVSQLQEGAPVEPRSGLKLAASNE